MSVSHDDVRHVADLARLALTDDQVVTLARELNGVLTHMAVLATVDTEGVQEAIGVGARGLPTRGDHGPPIPLLRSLDAFAPRVREGFLIVPRLASHEATAE